MRLIPNWRDIALKSYSMLAQYLGLMCLIVPEAVFVLFARDTNPKIWWLSGVSLLILGIGGRIVDQGIDNPKPPHRGTTLRSPWIVGVLALLVVAFAIWSGEQAPQVVESGPPVAVADAPTGGEPAPDPDAAFLAVAVPFVAGWEGLRLDAYRDVAGVPTICYGETKGVRMGDTATKAECDAMLAEQILAYRFGIHSHFTDDTLARRLPLPRDVAFASFAYNVGVAGAGKSTATRRLNAGDVPGACTALTWWNKAGGRVIRGLVRRRTAEEALCRQELA